MKKIALISSFCDTQDKLNVLKKNIETLKKNDLDVLLMSPIHLPENIQSMCDYYFQTKDNPVYDWPTKAIFFWREVFLDGKLIRMSRTVPDYGWAGLFQVKQLSEIALTLNYDFFYHMIYDLKIDENVIKYFDSPKQKMIFPSQNGEKVWKVGLHYMIFDRPNLKLFKSLITEESYLSIIKDDAFGWLERVASLLNCDTNLNPVEDEIFLFKDVDIFNYSKIQNLKFFVEKNDMETNNMKLLFYDLDEEKSIKIFNNDTEYDFTTNNNFLFELNFNKFNITQTIIEYQGIRQDITEDLIKVKHNTIS